MPFICDISYQICRMSFDYSIFRVAPTFSILSVHRLPSIHRLDLHCNFILRTKSFATRNRLSRWWRWKTHFKSARLPIVWRQVTCAGHYYSWRWAAIKMKTLSISDHCESFKMAKKTERNQLIFESQKSDQVTTRNLTRNSLLLLYQRLNQYPSTYHMKLLDNLSTVGRGLKLYTSIIFPQFPWPNHNFNRGAIVQI